jgi:Domain of unknown function (DUF4132)
MPTPQPRSLPLDPQDWFWATWRELPPLPLPTARPFEPEKLLASLKRRPKIVNYYYWEGLKISRALTLPEAQFWFLAMTCSRSLTSWALSAQTLLNTLQEALEAGTCDQSAPSEAEALAALGQAYWIASPDLILPLVHFFSPETILTWILDPTQIPIHPIPSAYSDPASQIEFAQQTIATALVLGWQGAVTPYLTETERHRCRQLTGAVLERTPWTPQFFNLTPPVYYLAANLGGFGEVLQKVVSAWPDQSYQNMYRGIWMRREDYVAHRRPRPQELLFGLGDPERVAFEMERLNLLINTNHHLKGWLAHREYEGFGPIAQTLLILNRKEDIGALMRQLVTIVAPEVAPTMVTLTQQPTTAELAARWLMEHSQVAMAGILGSLAGQSKVPEAIQKYLQRQVGRGEGEWMQAWIAEQLNTEAWSDTVKAELASLWTQKTLPPFEPDTLPTDLQVGLEAAQFGKAKLPKWLDPGDLTPLRGVNTQGQERSFSRSQMETVLQACRQSSLDHPHPFINLLKQHFFPSVLADFAWQLFERWLAVGAPSKEQWAFLTLGVLGNDTTVLQLTPLIRAWPGEGNHKRASAGLDCLKAIGTETALMQIHAIAQRIQYKSLKTKAMDCMATLAQERGLTEEQLADRIVPDCGLNAQGSKIYDYGSQQFRVILSADLKPLIRDPQNKLKPNLPRPTQQDDRPLAEAALEDWKILKKTLGQVVSLQAKRLERGMIEQRRWIRSEFETYLLGHPVLLNLARRLIWGGYHDSTGELITSFRITEDGTYGDCTDEEIQIPSELVLGIVHPAELSTAQLQDWGQLLSDYEIVPPFSQLSRTVFGLLPEEQGKTLIQRFAGASPPALIASAIFKNTGWHALSYAYCKSFPQANLTAIVSFEGWREVMPLGDLYFVAGLYPQCSTTVEGALSLGEISPVVLSEVLRNVGAIASKAES